MPDWTLELLLAIFSLLSEQLDFWLLFSFCTETEDFNTQVLLRGKKKIQIQMSQKLIYIVPTVCLRNYIPIYLLSVAFFNSKPSRVHVFLLESPQCSATGWNGQSTPISSSSISQYEVIVGMYN